MELNSKTRILVIAAHPDDEVFACGGTLLRAIKAGAAVAVVFLGEGISARFPFGEYDSQEFHDQTAVRTRSAKNALASLGIENITFGNRLCCQFDTYAMISIVKEIENHITMFKPSLLFTHNPAEVNIDHRITFDAVESACRPTRLDCPKEIYSFEIVCSGSWTFENTFKPNTYVDVSDYWKEKLIAWHHYEAEARPFPFPRSDEGLEALARYRGLSSGLIKAEAFRLIRKVV